MAGPSVEVYGLGLPLLGSGCVSVETVEPKDEERSRPKALGVVGAAVVAVVAPKYCCRERASLTLWR